MKETRLGKRTHIWCLALPMLLAGCASFAHSIAFESPAFASSVAQHKAPRHSKFSPAARRILDTYGFPADPSVREPRLAPVGWVDPVAQPGRALLLGQPTPAPRRNLSVEVGLFLPGKVALLEGTHEAIALHNAALSLWLRGSEEHVLEAEALLESAQEKVRALPASSIERASVQLLRGHMAFARYVEASQQGASQGPLQASATEATFASRLTLSDAARAARNRMLSAYGDAFERRDIVGLFALPGATLDGALLREGLARGFFPSRPQLHSELLYSPSRSSKKSMATAAPLRPTLSLLPLDPLRSFRSQAIPTLWNLAVLQASVGNWQSAFEVANTLEGVFDRLGKRAPVFSGKQGVPLVDAYDVNTVANGVWLLPRHRADMSASLFLLRASALESASDPIGVLEEADKAIRRAESPLLSAVGFHMVANIYMGLGNEALAAKAFDWAFGMDPRYPNLAPSLVFFSAENAFWRGERTRARQGFESFLSSVGDPMYGPWARLRLADLAHAQGEFGLATMEYERIRRLQPAHPAALEARVRLFCLESADVIPGLGTAVVRGLPVVRGTQSARVRAQALAEVLEAVGNAAAHLREQASACALGAKLALTEKETARARTRDEVAKRAEALLEHVNAFEEEHAESPYAVLHEARKQTLKLGREGQIVLSKNDCLKTLAFYEKHGERLFVEKGNSTLGEFRWGGGERVYLARCAFLVGQGSAPNAGPREQAEAKKAADSVLKRALKDAWEPSTLDLQKALVAFVAAPTARTEQSLLQLLADTDLLVATEKREKAGALLVKHPDFWSLVASSRLLASRLSRAAESTSKGAAFGGQAQSRRLAARARALPQESLGLEQALSNPGVLATDDKACLVVVSSFESIPRTRKENVFRSLSAQRLLAALGGQGAGGECFGLLANKFLLEARGGRSRLLEDSLLLPWLRAKGVAGATDEWLEHAWRLERRKGTQNAEVRALFKELSQNADNDIAKETARGWLEKNAPSGDAVR